MALSRDKKLNIVMLNMSPYSDWQNGIVNRNYFVFQELLKSCNISQILSIDFLGYGVKRGIKGLLKVNAKNEDKIVMKGLLSRCDKINDKISVYSCAYPLISAEKVVRDIQNLVVKLNMQDNLVLWSFNPIFLEIFGRIGEEEIIFDTVDNWAEHASYNKYKKMLENNYQKICQTVDIIFTVSQELIGLYNNRGRKNNLHWIPNGVDVEHFSHANIQSSNRLNLKPPIIGYVGTVQDRFDFDLYEYLIKKNQDKNFVVIGPIWQDVKSKADRLSKKYKNIYFLGRKSYEETVEFTKQFTVAIIPHKIDRFISSTNPMKMYEYLACGLPIVSTRGAGVDMFNELIYITNDYKNFSHYIDLAIKEDSEKLKQKRINTVREHSWENRVRQMIELIYH